MPIKESVLKQGFSFPTETDSELVLDASSTGLGVPEIAGGFCSCASFLMQEEYSFKKWFSLHIYDVWIAWFSGWSKTEWFLFFVKKLPSDRCSTMVLKQVTSCSSSRCCFFETAFCCHCHKVFFSFENLVPVILPSRGGIFPSPLSS